MTSFLLTFWFSNENIWFNPTEEDDILITKTFLDDIDTEPIIQTTYDYLHYIILYDQIVRHIDRVENTMYRGVYCKKAVRYSVHLLNNNLYEQFTPAERCFILLPLRHMFMKESIMLSLKWIKQFRKEEPHNSYYRRFYRATIKSLIKFSNPFMITNRVMFNKSLLCSTCLYGDSKSEVISKKWGNIFKSFVPKERITISLSGGVDSMVCAYILKQLGYDVVALMINYNNRYTCSDEVNMVSYWCSTMNIPFYVRHIFEINRTHDMDRTFYESITKMIRFNSYRFLDNPVILGHNLDDTIENIFSNIKKQRSFDNLFGMKHISIQDTVTIIRPMLEISKLDIVQFANEHNVPYLYDSTPKDCERGRMRDKLIPYMESFDSKIISGLVLMTKRYSDMATTYKQMLMDNTLIYEEKDNIIIEYVRCKDIDYWRMIFKKLYDTYDCSMPSIKSVRNFVKMLDKNCYVILSINMKAKITYDKVVIFLIL